MNLLLLPYDTETTGIPVYEAPSIDPRQPHIVSVCAALVTPTGEAVDTLNAIVRPDGWTIPQESIDVHGITNERAMDEGIPEAEVLERFLVMHERASMRIGHNEPFDSRLIRIAIKRFALSGRPDEEREALATRWSESASYCTMFGARQVMGGRNPKLAAAFEYFTGKPLENAHDAQQDARACWTIFTHLAKLPNPEIRAPITAEAIAAQLAKKLENRKGYADGTKTRKPAASARRRKTDAAPAPLGDSDNVGI